MKFRLLYKSVAVTAAIVLTATSCTKNLDRTPYIQVTSASVFNNPANIRLAFVKLYAGLSLSGQDVTSSPDIAASDVGSNVYLRNYWEAQELPTDEAIISWNDADLQQYHLMNWTYTNSFTRMMYNRIYLEVALCNEFLRQTTSDKLSANGITSDPNIANYRSEARYLRALAYWHAIDLFGNVPFVTENDPVGSFFPPQTTRAELFKYVEKELLDIQTSLPDARQNEYGRADKACAWMLLAKLYLNAQVYTGTPRYSDVITYCNKIISQGGYTLAANYANLFLTDSRNTNEIIFPIRANGLTSQSYGNTTFIIHAATGGSMDQATLGLKSGGWAGLRTTKTLVNLFPDPNGTTDKRAMFYTNGQTLDIAAVTDFSNGYTVTKFKNLSSTGVPGSDPSGNFVDTDFPMFRLGDVYLMYAEAAFKGGTGGSLATAVTYINALRQRAYGNTSGNITTADLSDDFFVAERGRELYWEGHRRTDLIRFNRFTPASYLWAWKGGVAAGTGVDAHYNLYPIPNTDLQANPTLKQNAGY